MRQLTRGQREALRDLAQIRLDKEKHCIDPHKDNREWYGDAVKCARRRGVTWQAIANTLGMSRQGAWLLFKDLSTDWERGRKPNIQPFKITESWEEELMQFISDSWSTSDPCP